MNNRKKMWLSSAVFVAVLFMWGIPLGVYMRNAFTFHFIGAALLFVCLFQFFGDFTSINELLDKTGGKRDVPGRSIAPFMVIPGFIFMFVLLFNFSHRKNSALDSNGVLVKGKVTNGESTTSTRRFQTTKSYSIDVVFQDSSGATYWFDESVSASEFNNTYQGEEVDVVYWKKDPHVAKVVLSKEALITYKKIPDEIIHVNNLIQILKGEIQEDSIKPYLNSINYEWKDGDEKGDFENTKLNQYIRYNKEKEGVILVLINQFDPGYGIQAEKGKLTFEQDLIQQGYKKKASAGEDGAAVELFYSDEYLVQKTTKREVEPGSIHMRFYEIFYVRKN